jgi:hypothetical protein
MTHLNPLGMSLQASQAQQRAAATEKDRQIAKAQTRAKDVAADSDRFEHQVESSEAFTAIHDEARQQGNRRHQSGAEREAELEVPAEEQANRLDVTA